MKAAALDGGLILTFEPRDAAFSGFASYDLWVFEALPPAPAASPNTNNGVTTP